MGSISQFRNSNILSAGQRPHPEVPGRRVNNAGSQTLRIRILGVGVGGQNLHFHQLPQEILMHDVKGKANRKASQKLNYL